MGNKHKVERGGEPNDPEMYGREEKEKERSRDRIENGVGCPLPPSVGKSE